MDEAKGARAHPIRTRGRPKEFCATLPTAALQLPSSAVSLRHGNNIRASYICTSGPSLTAAKGCIHGRLTED